MNWVEVKRRDGRVQYATINPNGGYCINGYGFVYQSLDAECITPIDAPPTDIKHTYVTLEGAERGFKAIIDKNQYWNGWLMPLIEENDAIAMLTELTKEPYSDEWITWKFDGHTITITDVFNQETEILDIKNVDGETYHNFKYLGWCFVECSQYYDNDF